MQFLTNFIVFLILLNITNGFMFNKFFNKKIYNKKRLYYNKLFENENTFEDIDDPIYIVISFKNDTVGKLLDDMNYFGLQVIFCDMHKYKKNELIKLYKKYIKNKKDFSYKTQPWIFENNHFVGGLFEIYSKIYKNI